MSSLPIEALDSIAAIRKRPAMFIGDVHAGSGLLHLVLELVANAVDEHLAGRAHRISVTIHADDSVTVEDDGRGIPVEIHASGRPIVEVAFTVLHPTPTFDGHIRHVHLGLHGVGIVAVNALSSSLRVEIARDGHLHRQTYLAGVPTAPLAVVGDTLRTGTRITFAPDPAIFSSTDLDSGILRERLREIACFNPGLVVGFVDERTEFVYPGGIIDLAARLGRGTESVPAAPLHVREQRGDIGVEIALRWSLRWSGQLRSFVNQQETLEGGTHVAGARRAWATLLRGAPAQERKTLAKRLDSRAIGIVSVTHHDPDFAGPTKARLASPDVQPVVESVVKTCIEAFVDSHPDDVARLLESVRAFA
jgi:DNA gyrase subunit B